MMTYMLSLALSAGANVCPSSIQDEQRLKTPAPGWIVEVGSWKRQLETVLIYIGHPSRREIVQGIHGKNGVMTWHFDGKQEVWVACQYFRSAVELKRSVGKPKLCRFDPEPGDGSGAALLVCR